MVVDQCYPWDPRVRKEATTLRRANYEIIVIAVRGKGQKIREEVDGVLVYRIPKMSLPVRRGSRRSASYWKALAKVQAISSFCFEHILFTLTSFAMSCYIYLQYGFNIIHLHNPPDTLFLIGAFYKLIRVHYVFDHHDLSPDLYRVRLSKGEDFMYMVLLMFEKLSCRISDLVISTNESYRDIEVSRHKVYSDKIFIVRNNPIFNGGIPSIGKSGPDNLKKVLLFLGMINPQDGVDQLLHILRYLVRERGVGDFVCKIVGDGDALPYVKELANKLQIEEYVRFEGFTDDGEAIHEYLKSCDIGIEPAPDNELNRYSTFIKVMEYMAAGKPVVAFDLKETRYSLGEFGILIPPGDVNGFALAIERLLKEPQLGRTLGSGGQEKIKDELNWDHSAANLLAAYKSLETG